MNGRAAILGLLEEKLRFVATHDAVTGLLSGPALVKMADEALALGRPFSLVTVLMDGLYHHGEHHGLPAGEHVLRTVARRLSDIAGSEQMLARIEGEIFAVLTFDPEPGLLADRLCAEIRRPIPWGSVELHLASAAGIVSSQGPWAGGTDMVPAGYTAARASLKLDGRGGAAHFTPEMRLRMEREALIEDRLWRAVAEGGLTMVMQPKVRAQDGRIQGAEALARWTDQVLGTVSPAEFIPIAERSGIIGDLTLWAMRRALAQAARWRSAGLNLSVAVNVSAVDLRQPNFAEVVRGIIASSGCPPECLVLELTESCLADDPERAAAQFRALKSLGISLSLDDFGTGYSSLSQLRRFPIDTLKIDRSFVMGIADDDGAEAIARTIVALASSFGMETVAEGVETGDQARILRQLGVGQLQGFLFSRPMTTEAFAAMVEDTPGIDRLAS